MAVAVRASSGAFTDSASTLAVTKPAGTASGDYLLALVGQDSDGAIANLTGDTADGFAQVGTDGTSTSTSPIIKAFGKVAGASEPASYTFTIASGSSCVLALLALTGVNTASPLSATTTYGNGTTATVTAPATPAGTVAVGDLLVTFHVAQFTGTATWTPPTGMTEAQDLDTTWCTGEAAYLVTTAAGAQAAKSATVAGGTPANNWKAMSLVIGQAAAATRPARLFLPF